MGMTRGPMGGGGFWKQKQKSVAVRARDAAPAPLIESMVMSNFCLDKFERRDVHATEFRLQPALFSCESVLFLFDCIVIVPVDCCFDYFYVV